MTELFYRLALCLVPQIGDVQARILVQQLGSATAVFKCKTRELEKIEGIGAMRAQSIHAFRNFAQAEAELQFISKNGVQPLFFTDEAYPRRLLHCPDAPALLFYKGKADLNASRMVAMVGTRSLTGYGKKMAESLVSSLAGFKVTIVSGLALGIDATAHRAAIDNKLPTIGVVAHGLDKIYPSDHVALARQVTESGGLLSEFFSGTKPDRHHFPLRNRIVAGMTDATIVVETHVKGGSMITAKLANEYNRDVFAVPGRTNDKLSSGCNHLIQHNKAVLLCNGEQLAAMMGWTENERPVHKKQKALFIELNEEEKRIVAFLEGNHSVHIDEINFGCGLSGSTIAAALLNLEIHGVIEGLPGKLYRLA
ncbi:MAG TPA: DNA-processing protein DprA [Flavisolibacter sp.]|nr:DNA-processing protein DprA [Flavisolibacter sp.]